MNALGLPGATIDGILGFTILGRYRLEIDLTEDRMTWTRLDYEPREPPTPRLKAGEEAKAAGGRRGDERAGAAGQGAGLPHGQAAGGAIAPPRVPGHGVGRCRGEPDSHWAAGPSRAGRLARRQAPAFRPATGSLRINGKAVDGLKAVALALAEVRPGDTVALVVRRGSGADARELKLVLTAGEGL